MTAPGTATGSTNLPESGPVNKCTSKDTKKSGSTRRVIPQVWSCAHVKFGCADTSQWQSPAASTSSHPTNRSWLEYETSVTIKSLFVRTVPSGLQCPTKILCDPRSWTTTPQITRPSPQLPPPFVNPSRASTSVWRLSNCTSRFETWSRPTCLCMTESWESSVLNSIPLLVPRTQCLYGTYPDTPGRLNRYLSLSRSTKR